MTGLSDETLGSKIRRAIFRISSVPVKKKVTLALHATNFSHQNDIIFALLISPPTQTPTPPFFVCTAYF